MNLLSAKAYAIATKAIGYVCAIEGHVSPALAKVTQDALTWLLWHILPA